MSGGSDVRPAFSILVPACNAERTLGETLESLVGQTRSDWEAIVVDDGSTDATRAVASSFARRDSRIHVASKENGGTASARNVAAGLAHAPLFCLLDADDTYLFSYLEYMGHFIEQHADFDIYSCEGYLVDSSGVRRPGDILAPTSGTISYTAEDLLVRNHIWVQSVFRSGVFDLVGGFEEHPHMLNEDYDFWLRALLRGARHIHSYQHLWVHRVSSGSKSADPLRVAAGNSFVLDRLMSSGELSGRRRRIARRSLARLSRTPEMLRADAARRLLESRLREGEFVGARRSYVAARRAYVSRLKYVCGLLLIMVSPRLFARVRHDVGGTERATSWT
jgi:glycosyltransferase involved in cell wall biosynthesis